MKQPRPVLIAAALAAGCAAFLFIAKNWINEEPEVDPRYEIVAQYPHDESAFTQGLEFLDNNLIESTGLVGESSIRIVEPQTGDIISSVSVGDGLFAEGVTAIDNSLYQLTWRDGRLLTYEVVEQTLVPTETEFQYEGEGWGLCYDGQQLVRSDGSNTLTFHSVDDFAKTGEVQVTEGNSNVERLNELECHDGKVFANIFGSSLIKLVDLEDGMVISTLNLEDLVPAETLGDSDAVLNGMALNPETNNLWVTGKRWPTMFELDISGLNGFK